MFALIPNKSTKSTNTTAKKNTLPQKLQRHIGNQMTTPQSDICIQRCGLSSDHLATARYNHVSTRTGRKPKGNKVRADGAFKPNEAGFPKNLWKKKYNPHHIIPISVVNKDVSPLLRQYFDEEWNGIMLPESPSQRAFCTYKYNYNQKAFTLPAHKSDTNPFNHPDYNVKVTNLIRSHTNSLKDIKCIATKIREKIKSTNAQYNRNLCLDHLNLDECSIDRSVK